MQLWDIFILAAVVFPVITALICYLLPSSSLRKGLVILISAVLIAAAFWLHTRVDLEPVALSFDWADQIIFILDLVLLGYVIYVARERKHPYLMVLAILQTAGLLWLELGLRPSTEYVHSLGIDRLSVVMFLVISVVGALITVYALRYMEEHEEHVGPARTGRFFLWFVTFLGVMNGLVLSNNLLWLYFFWEATTICSFQLIGHDDTEEARTAALRALFINSLGGLAMIGAILMLVKTFGGAGLSLLALVNSGLAITSTWFMAALALLVFGAFTKAAQFPFQGWLLGAMVAPTPVSALLHASTMVKAGVYLVLRLAPAYSGVLLSSAVALSGVFTFFAGSLLAVREDNAKLVLAYSTVANLGLIIACAGLNTPLAIDAAILLIIFHAVSKTLLFTSVGVVEHRLGSRNIENMEGLAVKMPDLAILLGVGACSMFLPPFGMLFSKWAAMEASIREPLMLFLFVAASTLNVLFWTKWLGRIIASASGEENQERRLLPLSGYYSVSLGVLALGVVVLSLGMGTVINHLVVPAAITWYPPAFNSLPGLNLASFSWANYFNPDIILPNRVFPEGNFPLALLFAALVLTYLIPLLLFKPHEEGEAKIYLSGENTDNSGNHTFLTAKEEPVDFTLGGYYFKSSLEGKIERGLNIIAVVILIIMAGVVCL